ncbi:MAG: AAA family ATPase [Candidatus Sericytochromatia bacterium]
MNTLKPLPLGEQVFKDIITENKLYVDKTEEIYKILATKNKFFFLARPRRFGKTLLINTFLEIFNGNKELFKGLWIYDKIDFKKYPIIKLSMNNLIYSEGIDKFKDSLLYHISGIYKEYKIELKTNDYILAFKQLIEELSKKDKVVLLIDEYDKPITEYIDNIEKANEMRSILRNFYETIKANDQYLHFCFITGISKFSKVSIFSSLNNLTDISMDKNHSKILGIEEKGLYSYFADRITLLAQEKNISENELKLIIKKMYNGYSWDGINSLYNPYSLLLLFQNMEIKKYWFDTGTPTLVTKIIKDFDLDVKELDNSLLTEEDFSFYEVEAMNPYALLFQTGYLTIKKIIEYDYQNREYLLGFPNIEVKEALLKALLKNMQKDNVSKISGARMIMFLRNKKLDEFFNILIAFFDRLPNQLHPEKSSPYKNKEFYYHNIFQIIFSLLGVDIKSEISTSKGFIDSVIELEDKIYIFEFKIGKSAEIALEQIKNKKYYNSYKASEKEIILVGVNFDINERNISKYDSTTL